MASTAGGVKERRDGALVGDWMSSALPDGNRGCQDCREFIRLCFAWADEESLLDGLRILKGTYVEEITRTSCINVRWTSKASAPWIC
ncbi:hypothetical protein BDW59DRAFT_144145 [Aspergillus cavernicola]|uniref:Uncharacterized protein n=1 Tax=Aspergillus cavernicola TaxID=176166 RepID=A0ABR4IHV1_9EURO